MHPARARAAVRAFTLIEVLVVIGIIAILATIVLVAVNPARQFAEARNSERQSDVAALVNAIGERTVDNAGLFEGDLWDGESTTTCPALATGTEYEIASGAGSADLSCLTPTYIPSRLPFDPAVSSAHWTSADDYDTGYHVLLDERGRYTVSAPGAELGEAISVTR